MTLTSHASFHSNCRLEPCLPRAHESRTGRRPVARRHTISIDFPVVAAAPPRYHLVALLLHEPPSNELHITLRFSQSALLRRGGADDAVVTLRMNTYKTSSREISVRQRLLFNLLGLAHARARDASPSFRPFDTRRNSHAAKGSGDLFLRPGFRLIRRKNRRRRFLRAREQASDVMKCNLSRCHECRGTSFRKFQIAA